MNRLSHRIALRDSAALEQIAQAVRATGSLNGAAKLLNVSRRSLCRWQILWPELYQAIETARKVAKAA